MTIKVIGAGVGRTGTHSLKIAFEQLLGGTCHHMVEVFAHPAEVPVWTDAFNGKMPDWKSFLGEYSSICDFPGACFYAELADAFPDAPVILSLRSGESWYESARNTIFHGLDGSRELGDPGWFEMVNAMMKNRFCDRYDDKAAMIAAFDKHNDDVRRRIPADRLVEWTPSDGWGPLCEALRVPTPAEPFPVTNTTNEFRDMLGLPPV